MTYCARSHAATPAGKVAGSIEGMTRDVPRYMTIVAVNGRQTAGSKLEIGRSAVRATIVTLMGSSASAVMAYARAAPSTPFRMVKKIMGGTMTATCTA